MVPMDNDAKKPTEMKLFFPPNLSTPKIKDQFEVCI